LASIQSDDKGQYRKRGQGIYPQGAKIRGIGEATKGRKKEKSGTWGGKARKIARNYSKLFLTKGNVTRRVEVGFRKVQPYAVKVGEKK